jgi:nicotinamide phosphoribosyltransferase
MNNNPLLMTDGYKTSHHLMYPENTELVFSNFTPRSTGFMPEKAKAIVVFGVQYTIKYIVDLYNKEFFSKPKDLVCQEARQYLSAYLGSEYDVSHFEALHDLGYLPIEIKALAEGSVVQEKIPIVTVHNTLPEFFWLTNFLETLISSLLWKPLHSASLVYAYKKLLVKEAKETDSNNMWFVDYQLHDFSFRGMQHPESAISSGLGFLTSSFGTDTVPTLAAARYYYNEPYSAGVSVPASEHAVMTAYGKESEIEGFRRLMKQFPTGILSIVSDSFDLWKVCTDYLCQLKDEILNRNGKIVIRPDSGDPVDIICGERLRVSNHSEYKGDNWNEVQMLPKEKGVVELLWDVFGGTVNEQGYKVLDSHIGCIYGDSITLDRAEEICKRLKSKGFASTNVVFGVGSYSLGYATRDSQGCAIKATYCEVAGQPREIYKDPITDSGSKKSAKGLIAVYKDPIGGFMLIDRVSWKEVNNCELKTLLKDGVITETTLEEIRNRIKNSIK